MRFEWDQRADVLYVRLADGEYDVSRTVQIDSGTLVDVDRFGNALGIEIIRPARLWPIEEVVTRFHVADADANALRSLWGQGDPESLDNRYPFAIPNTRLGVAS